MPALVPAVKVQVAAPVRLKLVTNILYSWGERNVACSSLGAATASAQQSMRLHWHAAVKQGTVMQSNVQTQAITPRLCFVGTILVPKLLPAASSPSLKL